MANLIMAADGSFADPEEKQPTPMEAIAAASEQRPGIEDQDINDGWLIEHTQPIDAGNGMMKYKIVLPDGSPFECSPFQIEHRRDMTKAWMSAVRGEILSRANAAADATRAAALKARRDKQMQGAGILVADAVPTPEEAAMLRAAVKPQPPAPPEEAIRNAVRAAKASSDTYEAPAPTAPPSDPLEYAKKQYEAASAEAEHWSALEAKAARNAKAAQKAALKWKTVMLSLTDDETDESPAPKAEASIHKASETRAEKAARILQTSATATRK